MTAAKYILAPILFIAALMGAQVAIGHYFFHWDAQVQLIDSHLGQEPEVLYFGDSVIKDSPTADRDHASIAQFLGRLLPGTPVADLSQGGTDAKLFAAMTQHIVAVQGHPTALIVPINLRSFSPEWNLRPDYQYERQKFILTHAPLFAYFYQPLAIFHTFKLPAVSQDEFMNAPVQYGTTTVGSVKDFEDPRQWSVVNDQTRRDKYIYFYMGSIAEDNLQLRALEDILRMGKEANIPVDVYITPINYRGGETLVGKDFMRQVTENTSFICSHVVAEGAECLDLSMTLGPENFSSVDFPSEHMTESGRTYVAERMYQEFFATSTDKR